MLVSVNVIVGVASQLSVADGEAGAGTALHSAVVFAGTPDNIGAVLSLTTIVCDWVELLLQLSVAFQVLVIV